MIKSFIIMLVATLCLAQGATAQEKPKAPAQDTLTMPVMSKADLDAFVYETFGRYTAQGTFQKGKFLSYLSRSNFLNNEEYEAIDNKIGELILYALYQYYDDALKRLSQNKKP